MKKVKELSEKNLSGRTVRKKSKEKNEGFFFFSSSWFLGWKEKRKKNYKKKKLKEWFFILTKTILASLRWRPKNSWRPVILPVITYSFFFGSHVGDALILTDSNRGTKLLYGW